jgi:hypothetical protein
VLSVEKVDPPPPPTSTFPTCIHFRAHLGAAPPTAPATVAAEPAATDARSNPPPPPWAQIFNYYKKHGHETIVMGASFRSAGEVCSSLLEPLLAPCPTP